MYNKFTCFIFFSLSMSISVTALASDTTLEKELEPLRVAALRSLKQPWSHYKDNFDAVQNTLAHALVVYGVPLQAYDPTITSPNSNKVVLMALEDAQTGANFLMKAIFKPRGKAHQKAEIAAANSARFLGMQYLVPPTVSGEFQQEPGVFSYYVDSQEDKNIWKEKLGLEQIRKLVLPESLDNFYAFCFVFGMWDLKWVNVLLVGESPNLNILSIDNESLLSSVYAPAGEHFYVCWKQDPEYSAESPYADLKEFSPTVLEEQSIPEAYNYLKRFFAHDKQVLALENQEDKKALIIKRIRSFLWGRKSVNQFVGKKCWWLQLYGGIPKIPAPHVTALKPCVQERFKSLDLSRLRELFDDQDDKNAVFSDEHYKAILKRRDQLLESLAAHLDF